MQKKSSRFKQLTEILNVNSEKRIYLIVIFISILIGILSAIFYYNETPSGDASYYFNAASLIKKNISNLLISRRIGVVESLNAIIQGLAFKLPGNDFVAVYILQILAYTVTALFIFKLATKIIGQAGAFITLGFYWINYHNWFQIYNFKPGVWVNLFLIFTFYYAFLIFQEPEKRKNYVLIGISAALLLLTDLRYLPHISIIFFMFIFARGIIFSRIKNIVLSVVIMIILISPWNIRQSMVFNKFVFISDLNMVTISSILNSKNYRSLTNHTYQLVNLDEDEFQNRFWGICDTLKLTPGELIYSRIEAKKISLNSQKVLINEKYLNLLEQGIFTREQIEKIIYKEDNRSKCIKLLKRAVAFWAPFKLKYSYDPLSEYKVFVPPASTTNNINRFLTLGILLPFFVVGIIALFIEKNLFGITLTWVFIIHTFVHILTWIEWRYILPILPLITIVALYGIKKIWVVILSMKFVENFS